jgi:hypothetical protein
MNIFKKEKKIMKKKKKRKEKNEKKKMIYVNDSYHPGKKTGFGPVRTKTISPIETWNSSVRKVS